MESNTTTQPPKHAGGRPRKLLSGQSLSRPLRMRLADNTYNRLLAKARASNQSLADYLRPHLARIARS